MSRRLTRRSILAGLGAIATLPILAACQPQIIEVEKVQVVEREVPVERVVTQIIEKEIEKVITRRGREGSPGRPGGRGRKGRHRGG